MGADLYRKTTKDQERLAQEAETDRLYQAMLDASKMAHEAKWSDLSPKSIASLKANADAARKAWSESFLAIENGDGWYFRDSYNNSNLLWKFDLSYWHDFPTFYGPEGDGVLVEEPCDPDEPDGEKCGNPVLYPAGAKKILAIMAEREQSFEGNIGGLPPEERDYFRQKYEAFKTFLNAVIEADDTIYCSC